MDSSEERLDPDLLHQIRNPATEILTVEDPDDRLSIDIFLAIGNASEGSYTSVRAAMLRRNPEYKILSYYKVKRLVSDLTGVVALEHDMCIDSCMAYTGPSTSTQLYQLGSQINCATQGHSLSSKVVHTAASLVTSLVMHLKSAL